MKSKNFFSLIFFVLLVGFAWRLAALREVVPYHEDEHVYMNRAVFLDLYLRGDFFNPLWQEFEADYPKLPDVLYGAALILAHQTSVQSSLAQTEFNKDAGEQTSWNVIYSQQYIPMAELPPVIYKRIAVVRVARWVSLGLTVGALGIIMLLGRELGDWLMGCIAATALIFHPLFTHVMLTTMGDAPLVFFSLASLYCWLRCMRSLHNGDQLPRWSTALGIVLGMAVSSKLNALFSLLFISVCLLIELRKASKLQRKKIIQAAAIIATWCVTVVLIFSPQIWLNPPEKFVEMILQRQHTIHWQQQLFPADALLTIPHRITAAAHWVFSWHDGYGEFPIRGEQVALFVFGLYILWRYRYKKRTTRHFIIWIVCVGGLTAMTVPLNWNRYFLPAVMAIIFVQTFGISFLLTYFLKKIEKKNFQYKKIFQ